jgi:hypothetical protein
MNIAPPRVIDVGTNVIEQVGELAFTNRQEVPQWFLDDLRAIKDDSVSKREGNFMLVASVPVVVHEEWLKQGYDMTREPYKKTLSRLKALHLDAFIATNKQV